VHAAVKVRTVLWRFMRSSPENQDAVRADVCGR
jgi:hypothetical protein